MPTPCNACPACPVGQNDRTGVKFFLFLSRSMCMLHAPCLLLHWGSMLHALCPMLYVLYPMLYALCSFPLRHACYSTGGSAIL